MRTTTVAAALISMLLACREPSAPKTPPVAPMYIIVLDLTASLNATQQTAMQQVIAHISRAMPARSRVVVLPLGAYVEKAGILVDLQLPDDRFARQKQALTQTRKELPATIMSAAVAFRNDVTDPLFSQYTCISDAIRQAEQLIRMQGDDSPVELIFISDMLEYCRTSLLGGMLSLEREDLRSELRRVDDLPKTVALADLRGARVTAIVPATGPTPTVTPQPEYASLRAFWRKVFSHCRSDDNSFFVGTTVPARLTRTTSHGVARPSQAQLPH